MIQAINVSQNKKKYPSFSGSFYQSPLLDKLYKENPGTEIVINKMADLVAKETCATLDIFVKPRPVAKAREILAPIELNSLGGQTYKLRPENIEIGYRDSNPSQKVEGNIGFFINTFVPPDLNISHIKNVLRDVVRNSCNF